jgi:circadian clock protein KaiC
MGVKSSIEDDFLKTGIDGLDFILDKGMPRKSIISLEGEPGTGKTIIAMQFLVKGIVESQESGAYITFEELPEQIYKDMLSFGWDLKELEKQNKFRLICVSPEVLLNGLLQHNGFIEMMLKEIDCKRLVIDSISLFRFHFAEDLKQYRSTLYSLRNIFRKMGITSIFIKETSQGSHAVDFENYVVDGVMKLALKEHFDIFRKRTIEVLKMRGTRIIEGEHIFAFEQDGINVIPALSAVEDKWSAHQRVIQTEITVLDEFLGGGIHEGSIKMIDVSSKDNYQYLTVAMFAGSIKQGKKAILILSAATNIKKLAEFFSYFSINLINEVLQENVILIECMNRPIPKEIEDKVLKADELNEDNFLEFWEMMKEKISNQPSEYLFYFDLLSLLSKYSRKLIWTFLEDYLPIMRENGMTSIILSSHDQHSEQDNTFLERISDGVIKTWIDGNYQYLQITKSQYGKMSRPYIVQNIEQVPFIHLV